MPDSYFGYNHLGKEWDRRSVNAAKAMDMAMFGGKKEEVEKLRTEMEKCRDNAIWNFEKTIEINPSYDFGHNNLGVCYARQGQHDLAIKQFEAALGCQRDLRQRHSNLCSELIGHKRFAEAAFHGERMCISATTAPAITSTSAWPMKGSIGCEGEKEEYKRAVDLDHRPENFMAHYQLARMLIQANDWKGRRRLPGEHREASAGQHPGWIQLVLVYAKMEDWTKAEEAAQRLLNMNPQGPGYQVFRSPWPPPSRAIGRRPRRRSRSSLPRMRRFSRCSNEIRAPSCGGAAARREIAISLFSLAGGNRRATAGLSSSVGWRYDWGRKTALLDKPAVAPRQRPLP